ncbi:MAG: hypothetical protein PHS57_10555 [Alphaproteobacteria bacterium]|nr:hypothetical protein [Alphaproteobacteria bacterium]
MPITKTTTYKNGNTTTQKEFYLSYSIRSEEKSEDVYEEGVLIASFFGPLAEKRAILFLNAEMMD